LKPEISIVLPVYNEEQEIVDRLMEKIESQHFFTENRTEVIVVDDGSQRVLEFPEKKHVRVLRHPRNLGNGAAIKTGARNALGDVLIFMDADGQHDPNDIRKLIAKLNEGYDMAVGARIADSHASLGRLMANTIYNRLASFMTGYTIEDLTSGFRAAKASKFRRFLYLLPNGFSYPTTSTMAFFRSGYPVAYVPIKAAQRSGTSKIKVIKDGLRFLVIILKIGTLFSPMRLFLPVSGLFFLTGLLYYLYTYLAFSRFTNMSALLFIASMFAFLIGILSEQISSLHYKGAENDWVEDD
jgi:glycosyltransferase involved in cell wall biosynthesis